VGAATSELERCSAAGTARHVYGDVRMRVYSERRWSVSPSRSLGPHGAELAGCVRRAISKHFRLLGELGRSPIEDSVLIGTPGPVLPAPARLMPIWLKARASGARVREVTAALRKLVPPDYTLTKDLCLQSDRASAREVEETWTYTAGAVVPPLWTPLLAKVLAYNVGWAISIAPGALMTHSQRGLCLELIGAERQAVLRRQFDTVGTGWVGGFNDILLHPRVELPGDQKYIEVDTQFGRICAVTVSGAVVCVGPTDPPLPQAPRPVASLALGHDFACGLDVQGVAFCWGKMATPPAGPFRRIRAGFQHACGLRFTGEIDCWPAGATLPLQARDFIDIGTGYSVCGIHRDGTTECAGTSFERHPVGRFTRLAMNWGEACGLRTDGTAGCWSWAGQPVETPTPERFKEIALGTIYRLCGRRMDDTVACWTTRSTPAPVPPTTGKLVQIAGSGETFCGVRPGGGVDCWGDPWPGRSLGGRHGTVTP
jgi:hypothetical protein